MKTVRIFISSPGDVAAGRDRAGKIFAWLQVEFSGLLILEPYFWENEAMSAHTDVQSQIEPPSKFDIVICLLFLRSEAIHRITSDRAILRTAAVSYGRRTLRAFGVSPEGWDLGPASMVRWK